MPTRRELARNNVRAGVFVTLGLLLMVAVVLILSDVITPLLRQERNYAVTYPVAVGIGNLRTGSEVRVGGMNLGTVTEVRPVIDEQEDRFGLIEVVFEIDRRVRLFEDALVFVSSPIIGAESWVEITSVGTPAAGDPPLGVIEGSTKAGLLGGLLGPDADVVMRRVVDFSEVLGRVPDDYDAHVVPVLEGAHAAIEDVEASAGDVRAIVGEARQQRWPTWADKVDEVLTWANEATRRLDTAMDEARALFSDGRAMVSENRPAIDETIENTRVASEQMRSAGERVNTELVAKAEAFLDDARATVDDARAALAAVRADYEGWTVAIDDTLGSAALASQQLKLATLEIRRSPWKLLYRPTEKELEHELLYESTRAFAMAATDLRAATESAERVLALSGGEIADDTTARRIAESLASSFERYEQAQKRLFEAILAE